MPDYRLIHRRARWIAVINVGLAVRGRAFNYHSVSY